MANISCPIHDDRTPSMTVYGPVAYCHVCNVSIPTSELNLPQSIKQSTKEPTNIKGRLEYIHSLPTKIIRGLQLPYDDQGFFLVWPNTEFYKKRLNDGKSRYVGPTGHKVPLYVCPGTSDHLLVVEGEINAASIHPLVWDDYKVCSPGSAGEMLRHIQYYLGYKKITIFADYDAPGVVHGLQLKELLLKHGKSVNLVLIEKDFNQILQDEGEQELFNFFKRNV